MTLHDIPALRPRRRDIRERMLVTLARLGLESVPEDIVSTTLSDDEIIEQLQDLGPSVKLGTDRRGRRSPSSSARPAAVSARRLAKTG